MAESLAFNIKKEKDMKKIKSPILRTIIAITLGLFVLILTSISMMTISTVTSLFIELPIIKNSYTHLSILTISILLIMLLNKGSLKEYGFSLSKNFPLVKIVLISLVFGFIPNLILKLSNASSDEFIPSKGFSFFEQVAYIWLFASISEEILTRGLIQGFLSPIKHIGINIFKHFISLPVIVVAMFFGAMHLMLFTMGVDTFTVVNIVFFGTILGLIAGYYKERTNSLVPAIIVHFCFNVGGSVLQINNLF